MGEGLTFESILDAVKRIDREVPQAMHIVVSHNMPKRHIGYSIKPLWAHPWIRPVLRLFGISELVMWLATPIYEDEGPYRIGNKLICSQRQYDAIKRETSA